MATFSTQCLRCGAIYTATRSDARFCSGRCRTAIYKERRRVAELSLDLAAFRKSIASILVRLGEADGDPETLAALGAEVAAFTPESLPARRVTK